MNQEDLRYAATHEWVHVDGDVATLGISAFAVEQLTDLVYIEMPDVGRQLVAGEAFGEIESVKAVSDLYSPIDGEVTEVNTALEQSLETFSNDPYGGGWILKAKLSDNSALEKLMSFTDKNNVRKKDKRE